MCSCVSEYTQRSTHTRHTGPCKKNKSTSSLMCSLNVSNSLQLLTECVFIIEKGYCPRDLCNEVFASVTNHTTTTATTSVTVLFVAADASAIIKLRCVLFHCFMFTMRSSWWWWRLCDVNSECFKKITAKGKILYSLPLFLEFFLYIDISLYLRRNSYLTGKLREGSTEQPCAHCTYKIVFLVCLQTCNKV